MNADLKLLAEQAALECGYTIANPSNTSIVVRGTSEDDVVLEFRQTLKLGLANAPLYSSIHWVSHPVLEGPTVTDPHYRIRCEIGLTA